MPLRYKLNLTLLLLAWALCAVLPLQAQAQTTDTPIPRQTAQKLAPHLLHTGTILTAFPYRIRVSDKEEFYTWLRANLPEASVQASKLPNTVLVTGLTASQLPQVAACPAVRYIDKPHRQPEEELELRDVDFVMNNVFAAQANFPEIAGQGMGVSIKERPFDASDIDLQGRVVQPEQMAGSYSPHATTMATLISGAGNSGPAGRGITQHSLVAHSSFDELLPDDSDALLKQGISVQNHSYGVGVENYYGLEASAYDALSFQYPELLHVFSSGNSGDKAETSGPYANFPGIANLTGQFKVAKNVLTVGALNPDGQVGMLSSTGPAYDGRIKPELVAHGAGGTSEAAAVVSGIALLVQQAYKARHGQLPSGDLVKAILINSADAVGKPGPSFSSGYGNANALGALRTVQKQGYFQNVVDQGQTQTFALQVPAGVYALKLTLAWQDPEAEPGAEKALVQDLDVQLRHSGTGYTWRPWVLSTYPHPDSLQQPARAGRDNLNNVEQIQVDAPTPGTYIVQVSGYHLPRGSQKFSLAYELKQEEEWLYPVQGTTLLAGQNTRIAWQTQGTANAPSTLQYRLHGSDVWQDLATGIAATDSHYTWQVPDTATRAQLRLVRQGIALTSGEFLIARPTALQLGYSCEEQVMLHWPAQANAQAYQLYHLRATHLEPYLQVSDTLIVLNRPNLESSHLAVAPIIQGIPAQYSRSLAVQSDNYACYVSSFQPKLTVSPDAASFSLSLSTIYQIMQVYLERKTTTGFETVSESKPDGSLQYELVDETPVPGRNVYRARVQTVDNKLIYSQEEAIFYTPERYTLVYPTPAQAGQPVYLAIADERVQAALYDRMGRLVQTTQATGALKEIPTTGLPSGLYIIRITTPSGTTLSGKVLLQ